MESQVALLISVLIPAYNEERHVENAVLSVKSAFAAVGEGDYEIIVCDNNSTDATAQVARDAGAKVVFEPHNQIARARNAAAQGANGEWLIFLDADSELGVALLDSTLQRMRSSMTGGGGALIEFDRGDLDWHVKLGLGFWNKLSRMVGWAAGSYIFCRREAWEEIGGFDEEWYAAEEIVFSRALKRWCGSRGLRFSILPNVRLRTSARKIDAYSFRQMLRLLLGFLVPGALKSREKCGYWYKRSS